MTLLYVDGFDEKDPSEWTNPYSTMDYSTGRLSGYARRYVNAGFGSPANENLGITASSSIYMGFGYKNDGLPSGYGSPFAGVTLYGDSGSTGHLMIYLGVDGKMRVVRGINTDATLLQAGTHSLVASTWYYIEIYATIADSGGRCTVKVNGTTDIDFTGDTKNGGTNTIIDYIRLAGDGYNSTGSGGYTWYDDLYICDANGSVNNTFLGDCQVQTLLPSGNGSANAWVGSDSNSTDNYLLVDEVPLSTSDYVGSATADAIDEYAFTDLTGTPTVYAVMARAIAQKSDSGSRSIALVARPSSTDYASSDLALSAASWNPVSKIWEVSPATSSAWTYTEVNGTQFGVKVRP